MDSFTLFTRQMNISELITLKELKLFRCFTNILLS
jgi:hypothetical protein